MADDLQITQTARGLSLRLRVSPKASRDALRGVHGGALKVHVTEPPERGKANEGVIRLLAKALGLPARSITIEAGHASHDKRVLVCGFAGGPEELKRALLG